MWSVTGIELTVLARAIFTLFCLALPRFPEWNVVVGAPFGCRMLILPCDSGVFFIHIDKQCILFVESCTIFMDHREFQNPVSTRGVIDE